MDFAKANPHANVIATDLSAIQPRFAAPPNCTFIIDDAEDEWVYPHLFDYVHSRMMVTCYDDHKLVMQHIFKNLVPGGWVEYQDAVFDFSWKEGVEFEAMKTWTALCKEGAMHFG